MKCTRLRACLPSARAYGIAGPGSGPRRIWLTGLLLMGIFLGNAAHAEQALVQLDVPRQSSFTAGERVPIVIELLVKGQFAGPTYIDIPEVEGAIIMQVSQRPVPGTRQFMGDTYASLSFDFALYPQRAKSLEVLPFTARFGSRERYDQPVLAHKLKTDSFVLTVHAPEGALPGELILSATSVQVTEAWSPEPVAAKVGDAFTRTLTVKAEGVAAMLLPVPDFARVDGLASYFGDPRVTDQTERGAFLAQRIDTVTYVCEREGVFEIPALAIRWWNPVEQGWHSRTFPALKLEVAAHPGMAGNTAGAGKPAGQPDVNVGWIQWLTGLLLLATLLVALTPRLVLRWRQWVERRSRSEAAHWARILRACRKPGAVGVYGALNQWLALFGYHSTDLAFQKVEGVTDCLAAECIRLQQNLVGFNSTWDTARFCAELANFRQIIRKRVHAGQQGALPPLNPLESSL